MLLLLLLIFELSANFSEFHSFELVGVAGA